MPASPTPTGMVKVVEEVDSVVASEAREDTEVDTEVTEVDTVVDMVDTEADTAVDTEADTAVVTEVEKEDTSL